MILSSLMLLIGPSVTTGPLMEGSSVEISGDAITSITEVDVPSDLPVSDARINRFPNEDHENLDATELEGGFCLGRTPAPLPASPLHVFLVLALCPSSDVDPPCARIFVGSI
ncbi:hypothetical protein Nepgr_030895 [Nepenthes gracilis]|uniref:Secreted protein n=1 Tax=Nepenthes gracilis TaxID=150966 RepID=A0AAD3Y4A8_NEPGR|nr:hypothetical protein Nepgr_030895 [Nepenthes gracilis]